jgi:tetraacyldisaccharide 4'-kinase
VSGDPGSDGWRPPTRPRSPWQRFWGAVLEARARRAAAHAERLPRPVVSVGNLHLGGGGKTPLVIALAARLAERGLRPAILSRGYRRQSRGALVVSRGAGPEVAPERAGDEPFLMASRLPGVPVVVGERRIEAGRLAWAAVAPPPDLFLLDDGFAHTALARDVDLLVFPAADPFAGGRLPPAGRLRAPLAAAARADAAVLTGAEGAPGEAERLAAALAPFGFAGRCFTSATVALPPRLDSGEVLAAATPVFAVAAIARPRAFFDAARSSGVDLRGRRAFRDHHAYPARDLEAVEEAARAAGAVCLLTTEKDAAKLAGRSGLPVATLAIEARPEPALVDWLVARIERALA